MARFTKNQQAILSMLANSKDGHAQIRGGFKYQSWIVTPTIRSLAAKNHIRYEHRNGWTALCLPHLNPQEPREHLDRPNFAILQEVLASFVGPISHYREVILAFQARCYTSKVTHDGTAYDLGSAIRYGYRHNLLEPEQWMRVCL